MKFKSLLLAMLIVFMAAGMALAQSKIDPYFQVRMFMGMSYVDDTLGGGEADIDYMQNAMLTSRFGLKAKAEKLSGQVEIGLKGNSYGNSLYLRHLYAKYKTDMGVEVLFGQTWTPYFALMGCQGEDFVGIGYGATYDGRLPQLRLTWKNIYFAAMSPRGIFNGGDTVVKSSTATGPVTNTKSTYDNYMPKIAVGYEYKSDMIDVGPGFALNYTKKDGAGDVGKVLSWIGYVHGKVKLGAFYTSFNATLSQNPGDFGIYQVSIAPVASNGIVTADMTNPVLTNSKLGPDNNAYVVEGFVEFGYKFGFGTASTGLGYVDNLDTDLQRMAIFGQVCIPVQKNFKITPSVLYLAQLDGQGFEIISGVKFQADF